MNFDLNVRDKLFNVAVNAELTNNKIILSNAYASVLEGNIIASGIVDLNNPISSVLSLNVNNVKAGPNYLSTKVYLKPVVNADNDEIKSRFTIASLSYANSMSNPMTFEFLYKKPEKEISIRLIPNEYHQPLYASYSLDNTNPIIASAKGIIPQDIFVVLLGQNIIDNLSSLNVEYTMSNAMYTGGKGNVHVLQASSKKIYTEEYLIRIGASVYKNIIDINDIYYRLSEDGGINANAKIEYDKNFNVKIDGNLNTPAGNYGLSGFSTTSTNGSKIIYASTDKSEIIASGVIATNGILDLNIKTPKTLSIKDIDINVDVNINNYMQQPLYLYGNVKANKNLAPIFALNTQFELSNQSIMFTNIILTYGENRITGDGILSSTDGITKFAALLKDLENNGIFALDTSINKNNIYGKITVNQLPFDVSGQAYGVLTANATIIGLMNNPVIYLEKFDIKDFQIPGMQFDISLNGYYRANELEIKDVLITKTGDFGMLTAKPFAKKQQIKIPYAYFSKELQNMTVEVNNMVFMSSFSGNINYNMRKLPDGREEYRLQTGPITINKRKLPEFGTTVIRDKNDILLTNTKNHGIKGAIVGEEGSRYGYLEVTSDIPTNNGIRYIEVEVKNEQGVTATFLVKQYPLEYIVAVPGWYSYRTDFKYNGSTVTYESGPYESPQSDDAEAPKTSGSDFKSKVYYNGSIYQYRYNRESEWVSTGWFQGYYRYGDWEVERYSKQSDNPNNNMYFVRITKTSNKYTLAVPALDKDGYTDSSNENNQLVSPAFMIASQLGTVSVQGYNSAKTHCREYAEKSLDGEVYEDWRLPTEKELWIIDKYQGDDESVIDRVLAGAYYWAASGKVLLTNEEENWWGNVTEWNEGTIGTGYSSAYIRCIRDVKANEPIMQED